MRSAKSWILALALMLPIATLTATRAEAGAAVSVSFFYDSLAPYGNWYASADFGYVWRPSHVSVGWRPYVDGRWAYSEIGWTFVANNAWGWGPYHYGRWYLDPYYGWVWVPGTEWAPAWVSFYEGPGWVGWAPLPPRVSIGVAFASPIRIDARAYSFVESRYFLDPYVGSRIQPIGSNATIVRSVRDVTRFDRVHGIAVNRGLAVDRIERATKSRVRTFRLAEQTDLARVSHAGIRGDSISVYRPRIDNRAAHPPKVTAGRPARFDSSPGHSGRKENAQPPARMERPAQTPHPERMSYTSRSEPPARTTHAATYESRRVTAPSKPAPSAHSQPQLAVPRASSAKPSKSAMSTQQSGHSTEHRPSVSGSAAGQRTSVGTRKTVAAAPVRPTTASSSHGVSGQRVQSTVHGKPTVSKTKSTDNARAHGGKSTTSKKPSTDKKPPHSG